ncbi:hypothetical protein BM1_06722 [Bipolaris maydis]|nr:hypothetical protein BM1_06722 [Bipolaris maydis]
MSSNWILGIREFITAFRPRTVIRPGGGVSVQVQDSESGWYLIENRTGKWIQIDTLKNKGKMDEKELGFLYQPLAM